jgi:hydrogenase maturation protease
MPSSANDAPILVIGYGNTLRGDDGVGCCAAELLAHDLPPTCAQVIACHQLLPELAQSVSRAKLVIFIDADQQLPAGQVVRWGIGPFEDAVKIVPGKGSNPVQGFNPHSLTPQGIVHLAQQLYARAAQAWVFSVGAADFDCGTNLSPKVQKALPKLVRDIAQTVRQFATKTESSHA